MKPAFSRLHPLLSFYFFGGYLTFALLFTHPLFLLTGFVGAIALTFAFGAGQSLRRNLPFYFVMGMMIAVANPLFNRRGVHILFYVGDRPVTLEATLYGLIMMVTLLTIFILFLSFNTALPPSRFLYAFSRFFQKVGLLLMLAMRFVPLLHRRFGQILTVQKTRGVNPLNGPLRKRVQDGMLVLQLLVSWSLEEAFQTAESMSARGYGASPIRSHDVTYRWDRENVGVLFALLATSAVCLTGWRQGAGVFVVYPALEPLTWTTRSAITYCSYVLFICAPLWIEGREKRTWRL